MKRLSRTWASAVVKFRLPLILGTLVLMGLSFFSFNRLYHDNSNENYFVENDPNLLAFNRLLDRFGETEYLVIGIPAREGDSDVFNAATINMIAELTEFLENHRHVTLVRSLSKYQYTHDDAGMMATDDLFEDIATLHEEPEALEHAREVMREETLALDKLITRDFQHTQIVARSIYITDENQHKVDLVQETEKFIGERAYRDKGFKLYLSGDPFIGERFQTLTEHDMAWLNPAMGLIILAILIAVFRTFSGTLAPLVVIISTLIFVTAIQALLKFPFTAVNSALIPTVIILSIGTAVHVLVEFFQFRRDGLPPEDAVKKTVEDLFYPILFTCVTTAIGFFALSVTELAPVREFAILAALAPMIIFILTMSTFPAVLSYIKERPPANGASTKNSVTGRFLDKLPNFIARNRGKLAISGIVFAAFSFYSVTYIKVDANIANYFKQDSSVNAGLDYFNEHFKGISNFEIIVDTGEDDGIKNPEILKRVDALQSAMEAYDETGVATSVVDFYKQIYQSLNENDKAWFRLPTSREMAAQFLLLYENTGPNEDLSDLKDFNNRYLRIQIPVLNMDESKATALLNDVYAMLERDFDDLEIEVTGGIVMNNAQNVYVNQGMFKSFGIAILVIGICFFFLFRSFKYGVIALVPSIIPILLTGGLVSFAGITMDLGTMIVGAMTIGIAVDDSIHLMSRYLLLRDRGHSVHSAIQQAINSSGKAVLLTSIILVSGFSIMLLGSFVSYIYVGLFSAMIMTFALIGDLIFMPAMLYVLDRDLTSTSDTPQKQDTPSHSKSEPTHREIEHA